MPELIAPDGLDNLESRAARIDRDVREEDDEDREDVRVIVAQSTEQDDGEREWRCIRQAVVEQHLLVLALLHRHPRALEREVADEVKSRVKDA